MMVKDVISELQRFDGNEGVTLFSKHDESDVFDIRFKNEGRNRVHLVYESRQSSELEEAQNELEDLQKVCNEAREILVEVYNFLAGLEDGPVSEADSVKILNMIGDAKLQLE